MQFWTPVDHANRKFNSITFGAPSSLHGCAEVQEGPWLLAIDPYWRSFSRSSCSSGLCCITPDLRHGNFQEQWESWLQGPTVSLQCRYRKINHSQTQRHLPLPISGRFSHPSVLSSLLRPIFCNSWGKSSLSLATYLNWGKRKPIRKTHTQINILVGSPLHITFYNSVCDL